MRRPSPFRNRTWLGPRPWGAIALLLVATAFPARGEGRGAELLPTDHPAWTDLEFLFNRTGLSGLPVFTRPLPRSDVADAVLRTLKEHPEIASWAPARRLSREFAPEIEQLGGASTFRETRPPVEWSDREVRFRAQAEVRASPTVTGSEGEIPSGTRGAIALRLYLPGQVFVLSDLGIEKIIDANPLGDSVVKNTPWYPSSNETYVALRTPALELAAGQLENRWGAGSSGALLMSDGALAVPGISYGRTLGHRFRFVAMTGALHHPEGRWVSAHRAEARIAPGLVVGVHEAAVYASSGFDPLYAIGLIPYTIVQRLLDRSATPGASVSPHRNNLLLGMTAVWRPGGGWRADAELLLDDLATESASQPDRLGYLAGVSWSGAALGSTGDFRAEFAKVYRYTYSVFYGANLVHDDVPLGYAPGPDVEHAEARFDRDVGLDARVGLGWEWTRKGEGAPGEYWDPADGQSRGAASHVSGVVERSNFPHARLEGTWRDVVWIRARLGVLDVRNLHHVPGDDHTSAHARFDARVQW